MKKSVIAMVLLSAVVFNIVPQTRLPTAPIAPETRSDPLSGTSSWSDQVEERLQLAISSIDYPVTPGDIYQLSYRESAGTIVTRQFQVDGHTILDLGVFGKINASNMTFYQLKQTVEELISRNYTYSTPSLSIISPGIFRVAVREGTSRVQYVTGWGLSRLSEIVSRANMPNSSLRDVERISRDGMTEHFDLLKARVPSTGGGDPFARPGDVIVLHPAERTVDLRGEVQRPGRFELVSNENLQDLIEIFGEGFTKKADLERLRIIRSTDAGGRIEYISFQKSSDTKFKLNDGDTVVVENKTSKSAQVWFEGAVTTPVQESDIVPTAGRDRDAASAQDSENGRFSHPIREGGKLSDVLQEVRFSILPSADLGAALVRRPGAGGFMVIDLKPLLSGSDFSNDIELVPNSTIFIPALRSTISVAGAVIQPGFIPYFPGAPAEYYISLSGGFNPEQSKGGGYTVYDQFGQKRRKNQPVLPGDSIFVKSNAMGYNLERRLPIWISTISVALTAISVGITLSQ